MCRKWIYLVSVVAVWFVAAPAGALLVDWEDAVAPASPGFLATHVEDGLYDIGTYGGEQTYEFVVKSNPDETEASMCLIGRRQFGDTQAGLKYEQWNNTGTYGATLFGVVDLDFGIPTSPGVDTHLVFVSSEAAGTCALYVNGVYQASVDAAIPLSGLVGIGYGAQGADGSDFFDDFDGDIYGVAIYDAVLSDDEILAHADAFFRPEPTDPGSEGLVAHYAMENDVNDSSGNELHGTMVGDPVFVEGLDGMALDFDGIDDVVELGTFDVTGQITLTAWVKADDFEINDARIISKAKEWGGDDHLWMLSTISETSLRFRLKTDEGPTTATLISDPVLEAGVWAPVAATWDGSTMQIYKDGVEVASQEKGGSVAAVDPNISAAIGSQPSDAFASDPSHVVKFFDGLIDEVRIYERGLSEGEVRYLAGDRPPPIVLLSEDFEGLPLGPNVDEELAGEAVWTDTPPDGWTVDESGVPGIGNPATDGVTEWAGWAFADKEWWTATAGDQDRSMFTLASGTVAVADPDEWDDADRLPIPISADPYDTWLTTPAIDISGVEAETVQLTFDSSWRPEFDDNYHQTANITASFDGADPVEVLLWESDESSPNYKPYATNETVVVDLGNPEGAKSVVLTFGLFDAGNDWWWAIDNVEVSGIPAPIRPYLYDGDAAVAGEADDHDSLDGSWDHNNGSDQWDGTGPGEGNPGGAAALVDEDGVTFLRIQDTGDPRDLGISEPSNRKVYFTRQTRVGLEGARLEVRLRVATSAPLDNLGEELWPEGGIGYHIRDNGKGMFGISDGAGVISFSLAKAGEPDFADVATDVLVMNNLVGAEASGDVDTGDAATAVNMLAIEDATQWNTFVIDIVAGGAGTHIVSVSANGGPAEVFEVTVGTGTEEDVPYITIGSSGTGGITAFDVDYISVGLAPPPAPVEVDPSLAIHYSFDEVSDIVADLSGKGHDGVVVGEVTAEPEGLIAGAAKFSNAGYLDLDGPGFPAEDIPTSGMTLAAWIKCENTGSHHAIFNARASDQTWLIHPEARSNGEFRWLLRSYGGTTMFDIRAGAVTWDEWLHFAGTYDKASGKAALCINGELVSEVDVTTPDDIAGDWGLGARVGKNIDDARPFTGLMDEFRMYTRALSQDEIAGL